MPFQPHSSNAARSPVPCGLGVKRVILQAPPPAAYRQCYWPVPFQLRSHMNEPLCRRCTATIFMITPWRLPVWRAGRAGLLALLALRIEPLVSGSGIPQVELMVRGQMRMNWLRVLLCKFAGTLVSLSGGLLLAARAFHHDGHRRWRGCGTFVGRTRR